MLEQGALSDDEVVKLARNLVPVHVDTDEDETTAEKFHIKTIPAIFFVDSEGKIIEKYKGARDAKSIGSQIRAIAKKHSRSFASLDLALEAGKDAKKPVVQVFVDDGDDSKALASALRNKDVAEKALLVWTKLTKENSKGAPWLVVLDPTEEKPEEKPLGRIDGKREASELSSKFDEYSKAIKK